MTQVSDFRTRIPHLLIVDDDDVSNYLTKVWLKPRNVCGKLSIALNGKEAQRLFQAYRAENQYPDLVLLDINMPLMNGFDFLDWYTSAGLTGSTKVAFYTTSIRRQDREKAKTYADVISFVEKPLDESIMAEILAEIPATN